ncbi:MAG: glycosyl hydrolase [Anaerolineae bacterium]
MKQLLVLIVLGTLVCAGCGPGATSPTPIPSRTPEPLVPTAVQQAEPTRKATSTGALEADPTSSLAPTPAQQRMPEERERFGVGVALAPITDYAVEELGIGWYLNWGVRLEPAHPAGAAFWQMVRVSEGGYRPDPDTIRAVASANPGSTWLIGNEPDVPWQDNTTPERYAAHYHDLYDLLKSADPTCQVAIGGVSQPTPLRLAYLERVLSSHESQYGEPIPVDVWNVHNFILREERDSWGVGIPPGMDADSGTLYEIEDHDDIEIFREQLVAFRRWMSEHEERDKPLVISEYGILMPEDYGFEPERVQRFMEATFDVFLTARDEAIGYPDDDNRLVQWWCWYSLSAPEDYYPTGNLFDPQTKVMTALGAAFARYEGP